ncbi:MAG: hypothetical protein ABFD58_07610 [Anaerolineaceae bacterium]
MARHWMMDPYTWLMQNAGPVVRWRTATEVIWDSCYRKHLTEELISHPAVRKWLERLSLDGLPTPLDMLDAACLKKLGSMVHGGKATCLENVFASWQNSGCVLVCLNWINVLYHSPSSIGNQIGRKISFFRSPGKG